MVNERSVRLSDLEVGMVLAKDIVDNQTNEVILERNVEIDENALLKLKEYFKMRSGDETFFHVYADENAVAKLTDEQREMFYAFQGAYETAENNAKRYLRSVEQGERIVLDDLLHLTNGALRHLKTRSDLFTFLDCLQQQDSFTYSHCINVALLSNLFGKWIGMTDNELNVLTCAAILVDIGKTKIDDAIWEKKEPLTDDDLEEIMKHTVYGYEMLQKQNMPEDIKLAVLQHHERIDGSGYPYGLKDKQINNYAKIIAICDVYDAMVRERPYRGKICAFDVIREFERRYLGKMDTRYLMIFLKNIAYNYLNRRVELSNGMYGEIVFINGNNYSSPLVRLDNGDCIDLATNRKVRILRVI